ncbi:DUF975 family protein, partial [Ruminococcaceae bacterium OttesenSCG-928-L11]|nr:DUF975 family protein [Ruminococcaceae bacterium OttesenSCG-928-L11]
MSLFAMLKGNAKKALRGNWGKAIAAVSILLGFHLLLTMLRQYAFTLFAAQPYDPAVLPFGASVSLSETVILSLSLLVTVLLGVPLQFGVNRWLYKLVKGENAPISDVFTYFEHFHSYIKSIWLYIGIFVRSFLWGALFLCLPSAMLVLSNELIRGRLIAVPGNYRVNVSLGAMGAVLSLILLVLAGVLYLVFVNRYALAMYLFFEEPEAGTLKLIRQSVRYSHGYRGSLFLFSLSFVGWFLLCALGIPYFYTLPYYLAAASLYALYIIEKNKLQDTATQSDTA